MGAARLHHPCCFRDQRRFGPGKLDNDAGLIVDGLVEFAAVLDLPDCRFGGNHFCHHLPLTKTADVVAEGAVGHAGHGRKQHPVAPAQPGQACILL